MKMILDIEMPSPGKKISYTDKTFLIGSCFTEHIGKKLSDYKFRIIQNPSGILFDPVSVAYSLQSYAENKKYQKEDLFFLNELWQSWQHHSMFSGMDAVEVLKEINNAQEEAHAFILESDWLIITLGSSFSYQLADSGKAVANCHRAPAKTFGKHLLTIDETVSALKQSLEKLFSINNKVQVIFTISPVRHIRDGVIENNRSKARLIEAVHQLVNGSDRLHYFPAYELVIDVLRDYRFYDIDMVHPNYQATEFVFNQFIETFIDVECKPVMEEVKRIVTAFKHKPFQPGTQAHQQFLDSFLEKTRQFQKRYPYLDLTNEMQYFLKRKK